MAGSCDAVGVSAGSSASSANASDGSAARVGIVRSSAAPIVAAR